MRCAARGRGGADRPRRRRPRRADLAARADAAVRLAAPRLRLGVARRPGRPARAVVQRVPARAGGRAVGVRAPLLERRARLGASCWLAPASARRSSTCRRSTRCGRPATARRSSSRRDLLGGALLIASGNLLRSRPRLIAARGRPGGRRAGGPAAAPAGQRRGRARGRRGVRGGRALEPRAAAARVRARELGAREGRPGPRRGDGQPRRLHAAGARLPEQGRRARLVRAADHQGRAAGARRQRDAPVQPPRDADADPGVPADRDRSPGSTPAPRRRW